MKATLQRHYLIIIFSIVFVFLSYGVYIDSGFTYFHYLFIYFLSLISSYIIFYKLINFQKLKSFVKIKIPNYNISTLSYILLIFSVISIIFHYIYLGYIPVIKAWYSIDSDYIFEIRRLVSEDASLIVNYISSFLIKGLLPFLIFYFYFKNNKKEYYILLIISSLYAVSLLHKSYIVTILLPVLIYSIFRIRILNILILCTIIIGALYFLVIVANPYLRTEQTIQEKNQESITSDVSSGLSKRVFNVPGKIVSEWFKIIPEKRPFLYGKGYNFLRPFGVNYVEYSTILYEDIFPENYKNGNRGSVNTACFMYDFANFGIFGLILSGIILSLIFILIQFIYHNTSADVSISLNLYSILVLSSTAITTLLFSGGWGLITFLFLIFAKGMKKV